MILDFNALKRRSGQFVKETFSIVKIPFYSCIYYNNTLYILWYGYKFPYKKILGNQENELLRTKRFDVFYMDVAIYKTWSVYKEIFEF